MVDWNPGRPGNRYENPVRQQGQDMIDDLPGLNRGLLLRPVHSGNAFEETVQRLLQTVRLGLIAPGEIGRASCRERV